MEKDIVTTTTRKGIFSFGLFHKVRRRGRERLRLRLRLRTFYSQQGKVILGQA
jgi:hypothetical protein